MTTLVVFAPCRHCLDALVGERLGHVDDEDDDAEVWHWWHLGTSSVWCDLILAPQGTTGDPVPSSDAIRDALGFEE